jgi:hypothetical protein
MKVCRYAPSEDLKVIVSEGLRLSPERCTHCSFPNVSKDGTGLYKINAWYNKMKKGSSSPHVHFYNGYDSIDEINCPTSVRA